MGARAIRSAQEEGDRPLSRIARGRLDENANQGIGLEIARKLAAKGMTVLIGSRNLARGEEAARSIDGDARAFQLDVTDRLSIAAAAERIRTELGRLPSTRSRSP